MIFFLSVFSALAPEKPLLTKSHEPKPQTAGFKGENRHTIQEFCFAEFLSFVPLQRKTQCLRQNLVAKVLWHIKSRFLPKAPSQSLRIQLTLNSLIRTPVPQAKTHTKAETGKPSPEFGLRRILEFCAFAEKNAVFLANQGCKGSQNGHVDRAKRVETS